MNEQAHLIADRMVELINAAGALSDFKAARRRRRPTVDLATESKTVVYVRPRTVAEEIETRRAARRDFVIAVILFRKVEIDINEEQAAELDRLADSIAGLFRFQTLTAADGSWAVQWIRTESDLYDEGLAENENVYANSQQFTFRMLA